MARTKPSEESELQNQVLPQNTSLRRPTEHEPVAEEDRLDGIDLRKINEIISSEDVQKGGFIRLERRGPFDQKYAYVCKLDPEAFDIDQITKLYGGGDYQGRTFRANGQMYKMFNFSIDARHKGALGEGQIKELAEAEKGGGMNKTLLEAALANKTGGPENNPNFMAKMMEMMGGRQDQSMLMMMTMMQTMTAQMNAAQENSTKMMVAMMTAMGASKPVGLDPVVVELLKQKASVDPLEHMLKMMGMAKELTAGAAPEKEKTMMEQVIGAAAPAVASLFMGKMQPPGQPQPSTQVIAQAPKPATQIQPSPDDMQAMMIRAFLNQVLAAAARGSDPALYVDMIFDNCSETQIGEIKRNLTDATWPVNLFGDDQRAVQFRPWLDELKKQLLLDEDAAIESIPSRPGDGTDAGSADSEQPAGKS